MKLEQKQIKQLGVGVVVAAALLYGYFAYMLGPLEQTEQTATAGIASLGPQIDGGKTQIAKTADMEKLAPAATAYITNLKNSIPDGEPIAWFPPKMADFFKSRGIDKCSTRLVSESADDMPGFRKLVWAIDLPRVDFVPLGAAIATLENSEPLIEVLHVSIDAGQQDVQNQHALLTVSTLVKS